MNKQSYLVNFWENVLKILEKISLFYVIRNVLLPNYTKGNYRFVDNWLVGHTILAAMYVILVTFEWLPLFIKYIFLVYGCLRVFEILIYQLNVIFIHPYNTNNYSLYSYRRMTIALLHNFFEIVFWFAGTYITMKYTSDIDVLTAVYQSFIHMVSFSLEIEESKWSLLTVFILQFQALMGVFMTIVSLARIVSLFPQPQSLDENEQEVNPQLYTQILDKLSVLDEQISKNQQQIDDNHDIYNKLDKIEEQLKKQELHLKR